jgi:hypothetical protein
MVEELLHEFRNLLMIQYARSNRALYRINRSIETFNNEAQNNKDWKVPSVRKPLRRSLSDDERTRLMHIAYELRTLELSPHMRYYINNL